jgi:hypothetical protein
VIRRLKATPEDSGMAKDDKAMSDPVDFYDLDSELTLLRAAVALLANCMGAHLIGQHDARRLMDLLKPRHERD